MKCLQRPCLHHHAMLQRFKLAAASATPRRVPAWSSKKKRKNTQRREGRGTDEEACRLEVREGVRQGGRSVTVAVVAAHRAPSKAPEHRVGGWGWQDGERGKLIDVPAASVIMGSRQGEDVVIACVAVAEKHPRERLSRARPGNVNVFEELRNELRPSWGRAALRRRSVDGTRKREHEDGFDAEVALHADGSVEKDRTGFLWPFKRCEYIDQRERTWKLNETAKTWLRRNSSSPEFSKHSRTKLSSGTESCPGSPWLRRFAHFHRAGHPFASVGGETELSQTASRQQRDGRKKDAFGNVGIKDRTVLVVNHESNAVSKSSEQTWAAGTPLVLGLLSPRHYVVFYLLHLVGFSSTNAVKVTLRPALLICFCLKTSLTSFDTKLLVGSSLPASYKARPEWSVAPLFHPSRPSRTLSHLCLSLLPLVCPFHHASYRAANRTGRWGGGLGSGEGGQGGGPGSLKTGRVVGGRESTSEAAYVLRLLLHDMRCPVKVKCSWNIEVHQRDVLLALHALHILFAPVRASASRSPFSFISPWVLFALFASWPRAGPSLDSGLGRNTEWRKSVQWFAVLFVCLFYLKYFAFLPLDFVDVSN
ncbi:hypothetical protein K438DRAFT_1944705 [Mycena galopus ATCC 62051]|nr:hypothetical protein K438DRAFT_1944705 [Mycena galopus ATCC 62051]